LEADDSQAEVLPDIIEAYGSPQEIAAAYKEIETRTKPPLSQPSYSGDLLFSTHIFDVFADPQAWGSLLYMFISMITGLLYFSWVTIGLSLALGFIVLIIGVPFTIIFLLSIKGLALVEGRVVEALLGVRMPRRITFFERNVSWWEQFKALLLEKRVWLSMVYMVLLLPLGLIYFTVFFTLVSLSLAFVVSPVIAAVFHLPIIHWGDASYYAPAWLIILLALAGVALVTGTMHLARFIGRAHGTLAKVMLVNS
ncbi:MAG: sensor domain-containing protein, partial [Anaerolineae bacterium]